MVDHLLVVVSNRLGGLIAQVRPVFERAQSVTWFKLIAALILLSVAGLALVVLAWLTLRMGRRHLRRVDAKLNESGGFASKMDPDDWSRKSLSNQQDSGTNKKNRLA